MFGKCIQLEPIVGSFVGRWPTRRMLPLVSSPVGFSSSPVCGAPDKAPVRDLGKTCAREACAAGHVRPIPGEAVYAGTSIA